MNYYRVAETYRRLLPKMTTLHHIPKSPLIHRCSGLIQEAYARNPPEGVVFRREGGTLYIGIRGMYFKYFDDWMECIRYISNQPLDKELTHIVKSRLKWFGGSRVIMTGHSLGGYKAILLSRELQDPRLQITVFNPACICDDQYLERIETLPNLTTYHVVGDVLSSFSGLENPAGIHRIEIPGLKHPHTIRNFLDKSIMSGTPGALS